MLYNGTDDFRKQTRRSFSFPATQLVAGARTTIAAARWPRDSRVSIATARSQTYLTVSQEPKPNIYTTVTSGRERYTTLRNQLFSYNFFTNTCLNFVTPNFPIYMLPYTFHIYIYIYEWRVWVSAVGTISNAYVCQNTILLLGVFENKTMRCQKCKTSCPFRSVILF